MVQVWRLGAASAPCVFRENAIYKNLDCMLKSTDILYTARLSRGMAGHSKWANIRHIKAGKDAVKQRTIIKFSRLIRFAIKEGGNADPKLNSMLAKAIESARCSNVPQASINNILETHQKSQDNAKSAILEYRGPSGLFILAELLTDNLNRSRGTLQGVLKKFNIQEARASAIRMFEEKGVVVAASKGTSLEAALDSAIETGAEEVVEEDDNLVFTCSPVDFIKVKQGLENLGYEITYADVDFIPKSPITFPEESAKQLATVIQKLEDIEDVIKIHVNAL